MNKKKVLVGMSGGVDSSVSAALLLDQGYEVIGAFMKNWSDGGNGQECSWRQERRDAMRVSVELGIPLLTFDYEKEYRNHVYEYMIDEYKAGRTPNPDVLCNKYMKFGYLLEEAEKLNCDYIATGHYARIERDENDTAHLLAGVDRNKDQTYFLCQLEQHQLSKILFPIGELEKPEVRKIAKKHNLFVADKKDSQGICFVGKVKMKDFLQERIPEEEGNIITTKGEIIGKHKGHAYYTIGQRTGLGIGGGIPYFIVDRRPESNEIVVAVGDNDPALFSNQIIVVNESETVNGNLKKFEGVKLKARIRYRQPLQEVVYKIENGMIIVDFSEDQRAVAPGQFIAFYNDEELVCSAVIQSAKKI